MGLLGDLARGLGNVLIKEYENAKRESQMAGRMDTDSLFKQMHNGNAMQRAAAAQELKERFKR
ncbi:MAG: hypothetical protein J6Z82_07090 [Schwartzia sp.]|nr:hypothetical protein [Schwartzia sp. (in: firmicutes)]